MVPSLPALPGSVGRNHHPSTPHYRTDLDEARKVQQQLLPRELPCLPDWDLAAACRPARVVSGDYCDVLDLPGGQVAVALGDVAGKGFGPALVMAGLRALAHAWLPHRTADLPGLLRELNAYLLATTPDDMFVTLFLAVLDLSAGRLRYVNAGHVPPLVLAGPGVEPLPLPASGLVLGVLPDVAFEECRVRLKPGSLLAVFSDGVTDATDRAGQMFHQRRVVEALRQGWGGTARHTLAHLLQAVEAFAQGLEQADDVSAILLRRQ
jgi:sigma-B regulation protein RsbU (phosphoserine phosphatase)